jgi:hypothetical protein
MTPTSRPATIDGGPRVYAAKYQYERRGRTATPLLPCRSMAAWRTASASAFHAVLTALGVAGLAGKYCR